MAVYAFLAGGGCASMWAAWLSILMRVASPLICKLNPFPPIEEGPGGAFFPALMAPGSATAPQPAPQTQRIFKLIYEKPALHHLRGDTLANWHRFGVQSIGAPSGRSPSASVQLPRVPILAACARSPDLRQAGGSRTFRLTHAQPDTCITKSPANSKPPPKGS